MRRPAPVALVAFAVMACLASRPLGAGESRAEAAGGAARLFDTGSHASTPLAADAVARKAGWTAVPEGGTAYSFRGDAALANGRLALVLRQSGRGAELYANGPNGHFLVAALLPLGESPAPPTGDEGRGTRGEKDTPPSGASSLPSRVPRPASQAEKLASLKVLASSSDSVAVEAGFEGDGGRMRLAVAFALGAGQPFVATRRTARGAEALRIEAPCRFAILPDFFADDIVLDAEAIAVPKAEIPCESFLLHLIGQGEALLAAVSPDREKDWQIDLSGQSTQRAIAASTIPYGKEGKIWIAALADPGVWHVRDVAKEDADRILPLDWKAPFPALWRVDWRLGDGLCDSWEMLTEKPDGRFDKPDWFGQPDRFGVGDWMKPDRWRWTTVLGSFRYPCWVGKDGRGYLQPLKRGRACQGPALVYPIGRVPATPLDRFTLVDILREALGKGPCEYILDVEGQRKVARGTPTCPTRTLLDAIYAHKQQKQRQAEVEKALDNVLAFVQQIRARIEAYAAFGRDLAAWLEEQRKAKPDLADSVAPMQAVVGRIEAAYERRRAGIRTPEEATALVDDFRKHLVGYDGPDALGRCQKLTAAIVGIGDNQDELVSECRVAVKVLRQQAGLTMAIDPRTADIAKEIRRRTQAILRAPAAVEAPRH